ncbi:hypothetical protein JXA40_00730 [bacterium]|nr:hypothetical protein [candidate division CSSED10-310 bacterium]
MRKTLRDIARRFNRENDIWLLAGNTSAVLQGAMIHSRKLTFYTLQTGAYKFGELFAPYKRERVKYREKPPLAGHIGLFSINEIDVSIVGQPEIFFEHRKYPIPIEDVYLYAETVQIEDQGIPLLPLEWLLILGIMADNTGLADAVSRCELDFERVLKTAGDMGVAHYLKTKLDGYRGT